MIKDDLIYSWDGSTSHLGRNLLSFLIVAVIFTFFLGAVNVRFEVASPSQIESASILNFDDGQMGRYWRLKAEEDGPFPGRLELQSDHESSAGIGFFSMAGSGDWSDYEIKLAPIEVTVGILNKELAQKGKRFFPNHRFSKLEVVDEKPDLNQVHKKVPILVPFDRSALAWMPDKLPEFHLEIANSASPAAWRFLLSLRPDGSVDQCISLGGEDESSNSRMVGWLQNIRFKRDDGERWLGVRVEFVNGRNHGS